MMLHRLFLLTFILPFILQAKQFEDNIVLYKHYKIDSDKLENKISTNNNEIDSSYPSPKDDSVYISSLFLNKLHFDLSRSDSPKDMQVSGSLSEAPPSSVKLRWTIAKDGVVHSSATTGEITGKNFDLLQRIPIRSGNYIYSAFVNGGSADLSLAIPFSVYNPPNLKYVSYSSYHLKMFDIILRPRDIWIDLKIIDTEGLIKGSDMEVFWEYSPIRDEVDFVNISSNVKNGEHRAFITYAGDYAENFTVKFYVRYKDGFEYFTSKVIYFDVSCVPDRCSPGPIYQQ